MAKKQKSPEEEEEEEEEEERRRTYSKVRHSLRLVKRENLLGYNIFGHHWFKTHFKMLPGRTWKLEADRKCRKFICV